jgi:poly [ADP-ribose] polymerase 6/8
MSDEDVDSESWIANPDSDLEVVIGEDDENDGMEWVPDDSGLERSIYSLGAIVNTYSAYMYDSPAELIGTRIIVSLKRNFLPLSQQAVYGFLVHPNLLEIRLELDDFDWTRPPVLIDVVHPILKNSYIGRPLITTIINDFFSPFYHPKSEYRSERRLLTPTGTADPEVLAGLVAQGYDAISASSALVLTDNNSEHAVRFLMTGELPDNRRLLTMEYGACPLLYFILELADAFLELSDHCCVCRAPLAPGLKPSVCNGTLCNFQLTGIGIGNSVFQEIQRDPSSADLVLSIFSAAIDTEFLNPAPPAELGSASAILAILENLPSMNDILMRANDDRQLLTLVGQDGLALLRWVLLSNRSHLISMPNAMRFKEFDSSRQFMTLLSSPESEDAFSRLKDTYGSLYLWHGSHGQRWHSILRNGLKNATGTRLQANGAVHGPGIYFARNSAISWRYSCATANRYARSELGKLLHIISLCEVANIPPDKQFRKSQGTLHCHRQVDKLSGGLNDHGWAYTLTMETACIVRFMMVGGNFAQDVVASPPHNIPTLRDVLELHAQAAL